MAAWSKGSKDIDTARLGGARPEASQPQMLNEFWSLNSNEFALDFASNLRFICAYVDVDLGANTEFR
jgi:hypothetical protein